jgi:hypothetical protein
MRRAGRGRLIVGDQRRLVGMPSLKDALQDFRSVATLVSRTRSLPG